MNRSQFLETDILWISKSEGYMVLFRVYQEREEEFGLRLATHYLSVKQK